MYDLFIDMLSSVMYIFCDDNNPGNSGSLAYNAEFASAGCAILALGIYESENLYVRAYIPAIETHELQVRVRILVFVFASWRMGSGAVAH
jgi:hypothetical protein